MINKMKNSFTILLIVGMLMMLGSCGLDKQENVQGQIEKMVERVRSVDISSNV